jgi:hypothetical protein
MAKYDAQKALHCAVFFSLLSRPLSQARTFSWSLILKFPQVPYTLPLGRNFLQFSATKSFKRDVMKYAGILKHHVHPVSPHLVSGTANPRLSGSKYENCYSRLSTCFKRHAAFRKADESLLCSDKTWDSFFKPALLRSDTSTTSESSIDDVLSSYSF